VARLLPTQDRLSKVRHAHAHASVGSGVVLVGYHFLSTCSYSLLTRSASLALVVLATCEPALNGTNECFVLQTTFIILVEGPVDTDVATYESYSAIKKAMDDGGYTQVVPTVVSLEFLSPLPLIPPGNTSPSEQVDSDLQRTVDVSPWTIGFSVASVMGGFVSLLVYARSRKRRRALLDETTPWVSPNDDAAVI